jgi:hypothetical protein
MAWALRCIADRCPDVSRAPFVAGPAFLCCSPGPASMVAMSAATDLAPGSLVARCADLDADGGRCQLRPVHGGRHAAQIEQVVVVWDDSEVYRWPLDRAGVHWLVDLPWAAGFPRGDEQLRHH